MSISSSTHSVVNACQTNCRSSPSTIERQQLENFLHTLQTFWNQRIPKIGDGVVIGIECPAVLRWCQKFHGAVVCSPLLEYSSSSLVDFLNNSQLFRTYCRIWHSFPAEIHGLPGFFIILCR